MLAPPLPDADETRDNAAFEAILNAFARPGSVRTLPAPGPACVALALVDAECRAYADDPALADLLRRSGAAMVPPELADHLFLALDTAAALDRIAGVPTGTLLYPDQGATLCVPAAIGTGPELALTGPGIETEARVRLSDLHPRLWALRAALCRYPRGIETIFVDGAKVLALPRSTAVREV